MIDLQHKPIQERRLFARSGDLISVALGLNCCAATSGTWSRSWSERQPGYDVLQPPGWPLAEYREAFTTIEQALANGLESRVVGERIGNEVAARETVPLALFCFLRHPDNFARVVEQALFVGGDTDTTAAMAGALCGARVGLAGLPRPWLGKVREKDYTVGRVGGLARELFSRSLQQDNLPRLI